MAGKILDFLIPQQKNYAKQKNIIRVISALPARSAESNNQNPDDFEISFSVALQGALISRGYGR